MEDKILEGTNMIELGKCIKNIREQSEMTAEALVESAGLVSRPSLTRLETGRATAPSFDTIFRLLKAIGQLDVVKRNDFDFTPYPEHIKELVCHFIKDETGAPSLSFKESILSDMDKECKLTSRQWEDVSSYAHYLSGRTCLNQKASELRELLKGLDMTVDDINSRNVCEYIARGNSFQLMYASFILSLNTDPKLADVFELVVKLIEVVGEYACDINNNKVMGEETKEL